MLKRQVKTYAIFPSTWCKENHQHRKETGNTAKGLFLQC